MFTHLTHFGLDRDGMRGVDNRGFFGNVVMRYIPVILTIWCLDMLVIRQF